MRILYLPIFEGGSVHDTQVDNKRGLYNALWDAGHTVFEVDYLKHHAAEILYDELVRLLTDAPRDLVISQFHGANILTPDEIRWLRAINPDMLWVNWSGDSWAHSLTAPDILDMCRAFDLQLVAAPEVLPVYAEHGIPAAFWNIAIEVPVGALPEMPAYDIVFLANTITGERRSLFEWLRTIDYTVGIYGDWENSDGRNVYDFGAGEALYKRAKFAICDNPYPDTRKYISNRPMQALAAGGALVMHQHVPDMKGLSKLIAGVHYIEWTNTDDLLAYMNYFRQHEDERVKIVNAGQRMALAHHTYTERVRELEALLATIAEGANA